MAFQGGGGRQHVQDVSGEMLVMVNHRNDGQNNDQTPQSP